MLLDDKIGLIDEDGNEVVSPKYDILNRLDQFAFIFQMDKDKREYGLINFQGKIIIDSLSNRPAEDPTPGLYKITSNTGDYYFVDKYGTKYIKR